MLVLTPAIDGADGISAVSRHVVRALAGMAEPAAIEVWTLAGGAPPDLPAGAALRSARGSKAALAATAMGRARSRLDDSLVVVMHVHLAPVALALALRGARLAVFLHGVEAWRPLRARETAALARAAVLVANSHWTAARFKRANPRFADLDVHVCHLGIDPAPPVPVEPPDPAGYALIVARVSAEERYKGHQPLIESWPEVRAAWPGARLIAVGGGNDRARLESLAAARGVADAVRFVGRVSEGELAGYYRDAAFLAMPSTGEGFGLTYLEAMRAGKACLAGPGAAEEIVEDGVTGLIVDPSSPRALQAALVRLFGDPAACAVMGWAGASRLAARFTTGRFADRLIGALSPVCQMGRSEVVR